MTELLWPRASIRHPWPDQHSPANHPKQEPHGLATASSSALGCAQQCVFLPRLGGSNGNAYRDQYLAIYDLSNTPYHDATMTGCHGSGNRSFFVLRAKSDT